MAYRLRHPQIPARTLCYTESLAYETNHYHDAMIGAMSHSTPHEKVCNALYRQWNDSWYLLNRAVCGDTEHREQLLTWAEIFDKHIKEVE